MKRLILISFLFVAGVCAAQVPPQIQGAGAPTNPCFNGGQQYVDQTNHVIYGCPSNGSNWALLGIGNIQPNTATITGAGAPSGNCFATSIYYINTSNGDFYDCPTPGSAWVKSSGGSMTWPSGGAGVPNYNGSSAWGTSYSASSPFPANFLPTTTLFNNPTDNSVALDGLSNRYTNLWLSGVFGWTNGSGTADTGLSRVSAGITGVGTGANGSTAGTIQATTFQGVGSNGGVSGTEGTGASGCTAALTTDCLYPDSTLHTWHISANNVDLGAIMAANGGNTGGAAFTLNMGASTAASALTVPKIAGCAPTGDGQLCEDTTAHHIKVGSNGSTIDLQTGGGGTTIDPTTNAFFSDDFECSAPSGGVVGCQLWAFGGTGSSTGAFTGTSSGNYWGAETCTTAAGATNFCDLHLQRFSYPFYTTFTGGSIKIRARLNAITNINFFAGIYNTNSGQGETSPGYAGIAFNKGKSDTTWMCVASIDATGPNTTRTTVAGTVDTNFHDFVITWTAAKTISCTVDGGAATNLASTNFPTDANETPEIEVDNNGTANAQSVSVDYYFHNLTGLAR